MWKMWLQKLKKNKNDNPLPFLRKNKKKFLFESSSAGKTTKRKAIALGPMDEIFQKEKREEFDLTIFIFIFWFLSELRILQCCMLVSIY